MASSVFQMRIDDDLKDAAREVYANIGMDLPTAIRIFLKRSVMENGIPFEMRLPKREESSGENTSQ